jgi:SAM-dependent methyltransferase
VPSTAPYDEIADWYEHEFLTRSRGLSRHPLGIDSALRDLLGAGKGPCLEIGCGTGEWAAMVRGLGWTPIGVDLSAGMLSLDPPNHIRELLSPVWTVLWVMWA